MDFSTLDFSVDLTEHTYAPTTLSRFSSLILHFRPCLSTGCSPTDLQTRQGHVNKVPMLGPTPFNEIAVT